MLIKSTEALTIYIDKYFQLHFITEHSTIFLTHNSSFLCFTFSFFCVTVFISTYIRSSFQRTHTHTCHQSIHNSMYCIQYRNIHPSTQKINGKQSKKQQNTNYIIFDVSTFVVYFGILFYFLF